MFCPADHKTSVCNQTMQKDNVGRRSFWEKRERERERERQCVLEKEREG